MTKLLKCKNHPLYSESIISNLLTYFTSQFTNYYENMYQIGKSSLYSITYILNKSNLYFILILYRCSSNKTALIFCETPKLKLKLSNENIWQIYVAEYQNLQCKVGYVMPNWYFLFFFGFDAKINPINLHFKTRFLIKIWYSKNLNSWKIMLKIEFKEDFHISSSINAYY